MKIGRYGVALLALLGLSLPALANEIKLTETIDVIDVMHEGKKVRVQRIQDPENVLTGFYTKTSRKCPPFCAHAMSAAPGVTTVGEVEVIDFMQKQLKNGTGFMIDARMPDWYAKGTIPGSINVPFTIFTEQAGPADGTLRNTLRQFGVKQGKNALLDFSEAKELLVWCNGPWCDQSPRAIKGLLALGYPASKIYYYRGGMQMWLMFGLTTVVPSAGTTAAK